VIRPGFRAETALLHRLSGRNVYFKVKHSQHNLQRAFVQFKLAESISLEADIRRIIHGMVSPAT
jgi:hypothetical protein